MGTEAEKAPSGYTVSVCASVVWRATRRLIVTMVASMARVGDANRVLLIGARVGTADAAPLGQAGASFLFLILSILSAQPLEKLRNQGYFCRKTLGMFKQT